MLQVILTIYLLFLLLINAGHGFLGNPCNVHDLRSQSEQCGRFEICDGHTNTCRCLPGYVKLDTTTCGKDEKTPDSGKNSAVSPNSSSLVNTQKGGGSLVTGFLLPFFVLIFLVGGVYFSRKYKLIHWVQNKVYSFRRTNYDEFMIGQDGDDDPPLR